MKNPTKILYLTICPPENIKNRNWSVQHIHGMNLESDPDLLMMDIKNTKMTVREW
jgi:hypothetical protein